MENDVENIIISPVTNVFSIINPNYLPEALMAYRLCTGHLNFRAQIFGLTRSKSCGRFLGFSYDPKCSDWGKQHCTLGRICDYIQCHAKYFNIPDRTRIILNQKNKIAYSSDPSKINLDGDEVASVFDFPWKELPPQVETVESYEMSYAHYHKTSTAAKKLGVQS